MNQWCMVVCCLVTAGSAAAQSPNPIVILDTNHGVIKLELLADKAPLTVGNFLQYVDDGFYDGTLFHRVYKDFYIQGGGFERGPKEKKTRAPIKSEADGSMRNVRGAVGLTRTGTSQFYINVNDNAHLDELRPAYTIFGKVVGGMDVVDKIRTVATVNKDKFDAWPLEYVVIRSIRLASQFRLAVSQGAVYAANQVFTITAHVEYPVRGQTLTLELPAGLERVDGKEIQPIALVPEVNVSFVAWRVRGLRAGEYECVVRSNSGKVQSMKIKVATAAK